MIVEYSPLHRGQKMIDVYLNIVDDISIDDISDRFLKKGWVLFDLQPIDGLLEIWLFTNRNIDADVLVTYIQKDEADRFTRSETQVPDSYRKRKSEKICFDRTTCRRNKDVLTYEEMFRNRK